MTVLPLDGRIVAVTRPAGRSAALTARLAAAGADVAEIPLIAIQPPSDGGAALAQVWERLAEFGWIVVTSVSAVRALAPLPQQETDPAPEWAAVGHGTAEALAAIGRHPSLVPPRQAVSGLAQTFPAAPRNGKVLLIQAERPAPGLARSLERRGWRVERVAAYRTVGMHLDPADAARLACVDVATLASPSAARQMAELGVTSVPVVCIGGVTAMAAEEKGLHVAAVSAAPDPEAFTAAVISAVGLTA